MPDIFDQVAAGAPAAGGGDIFDQVAAPAARPRLPSAARELLTPMQAPAAPRAVAMPPADPQAPTGLRPWLEQLVDRLPDLPWQGGDKVAAGGLSTLITGDAPRVPTPDNLPDPTTPAESAARTHAPDPFTIPGPRHQGFIGPPRPPGPELRAGRAPLLERALDMLPRPPLARFIDAVDDALFGRAERGFQENKMRALLARQGITDAPAVPAPPAVPPVYQSEMLQRRGLYPAAPQPAAPPPELSAAQRFAQEVVPPAEPVAHAPLISLQPRAWEDPEYRPGGTLEATVREATRFAEGLTSPTNVGLIAGTGGLGLVGRAAHTAQKLVSAGFAADMSYAAAQESPELMAALERGDEIAAQEALTRMLLTGTFARQAGQHATGRPTQVMPEWTARGRTERMLSAAQERGLTDPRLLRVPAVESGARQANQAAARGLEIVDDLAAAALREPARPPQVERPAPAVSPAAFEPAARTGPAAEGTQTAPARAATPPPAAGPAPAPEVPRRVGTPEGAAADTALWQRARAELGEGAPVGEVARRAQELKTEASRPAPARPAAQGDIFDAVAGERAQKAAEPAAGAAAAFEPVRGSGEVVRIPRSQIITDEARFQMRERLNQGRVEAIAENMRQRGAFGDKEPLDVWRDPESGQLIVLSGHHRLAASDLARLDTVTGRVFTDMTLEQARDFARRSNSKAAPLTPMENARAFKVEREAGRSLEEIGREYGGLRADQVEGLLALNNLPRELQQHVQAGVFDTAKAIVLGKAAARHSIPPEVQLEAFDYIVKRRDITPTQFTRLLDTFAPAAVKQSGFDFGAQAGFEGMAGFKGLASVMDQYNAQVRQAASSRNRLRGFVNEIERRQREGVPVRKADIGTKNRMAREVKKLEQQIAKMEADAGSGKLYKTLGQAVKEGKAAAEPEVTEGRAELRTPAAVAEYRQRGGKRAPEFLGEDVTLPGMERVPAERAQARAAAEGELLTQELRSPKRDVSRAAGELERRSPLFREVEASGQKEMFGREPGKVEPVERALPEVPPVEGAGGGGQTTLFSHVNPLVPMGQAWTRLAGAPLWELMRKGTHAGLGKLGLGPWLITRYGQPREFVEAHRGRRREIVEGFERAQEIGERLTQDFTQAEQQALGRLIKGAATEADLARVRSDAKWADAVEAAKLARQELDSLGGQAVVQGLLKDESFFRNYGKYMPRLYRKWEVNYEGLIQQYRERQPTRLDLSRFKRRQDIPEHVRLMMGEILEPGYPVAKGIAQMTHDVATQKLFRQVADNAEWSFTPDSLFAQGKNPRDFVLMPESKKLGPLSGRYVQRYIADEINQIVRARSEAEKLGRALISEWKFGKVVLNPATHGRNLMSNMMLAYLGGLPPTRLDIYGKALWDLRNKGKWYKEAREAGMLSGDTYAAAEFDLLLDSWNRSRGGLMERLGSMAHELRQGRPAAALANVKPSQWKIGEKAADLYQGEEAWFKLAKYIHNREKGMAPKAAAADAQKWLFDYSEVPKFVDWARRSPFGAPFITFTYKALPAVAESAVKTPWRLAGILATLYGVQQASAAALGITSDQLEKLQNEVLPERMRGKFAGAPKFLLLPFRDKYGQLQFLDLTYTLPWGDLGETGATGIPQALPVYAGPGKALFEVMLNKSGFTGREIYKPTDSMGEAFAKMSDFVLKQALPPLTPEIPALKVGEEQLFRGGYGYERLKKSVTKEPDYFGRTTQPSSAVGSSLLGLKVNPIAPEREHFFRTRELEQQYRDLVTEAYRIRGHQGLSEAEKDRRIELLRQKAEKLGVQGARLAQ